LLPTTTICTTTLNSTHVCTVCPITNYITEVSKDDPNRFITSFEPYRPSPVSPDAIDDKDLALIQVAHYWLQMDCWIWKHNTEVEEEKILKAEEEQKVAEERWRAEEEEQKEAEWRRKEKKERVGW